MRITVRIKPNAKQEKVEKVFENVKSHEVEDIEEFEMEKKEKETLERLLKDNQILSAIGVLKGIRVFKNFKSPITYVFEKE